MSAYSVARGFGRGRIVAAWLQVRFWLTGRTGRYKIAASPPSRPHERMSD